MRLFMIYPAGNFIECTTDTPYLQIGEHKYGKPVLDRAMHYDVELVRGAQDQPDLDGFHHALQSRRRPADRRAGGALATSATADLNHRIEAGEPYFHDLRSRWSAALRAAHQNIPQATLQDRTENLNRNEKP